MSLRVPLLCTGVRSNGSRTRLSVLCGVQDRIAVHRSQIKRPLCTCVFSVVVLFGSLGLGILGIVGTVHRSRFAQSLCTSLCLVWGLGPHSCAPESDQTTPVHMDPSLTVFDVTCRCTGVVLHNPSAYLCALYEPQGTIAVHRSLIKRLPYTSVCLVWGSGPHSCAPESDQTTPPCTWILL